MHRLVQEVTLGRLSDADYEQHTAEAVRLLAELFPFKGHEPSQWPRCAQLLSHAQAVLNHARNLPLAIPSLARLLTSTSNYLSGRALNVRVAVEFHEQALAMYR
jgi:hypothetical protein